MWWEDHGAVLTARARPLLAQRLSQVHVLRGHACGHWRLLLHEGQHDPLQERLLQVGSQPLMSLATVWSICIFHPTCVLGCHTLSLYHVQVHPKWRMFMQMFIIMDTCPVFTLQSSVCCMNHLLWNLISVGLWFLRSVLMGFIINPPSVLGCRHDF